MNKTNSLLKLMLLLTFFSIKTEASLSVHPEIIKDTVLAGSNETSLLYITNSTSTLSYDLSSDVSWISFSSAKGSINEGDTVSVTIYYDALNQQSGINNTNIYVEDPHHGPITIPVEVYVQSVLDVREEYSPNSPASFSLMQNYPNPFNPSTKINYSLPEPQKVIIKVYNILGNEIMTLVNGDKSEGSYSLSLDLTGYASGVYFYAIKTSKYYATRKMILTK